MSQSAFITFVDGSEVASVTLDELKSQLLHYREQTQLTGEQLNWDYAEAAFPYTIETKPDQEQEWFYLKGSDPLYRHIVFGVGENEDSRHYVQMVLPDGATHGDKAKGNELCKYLAKKWKAELTLFNGRIMHYNPRK
ncbi:DUF1885 family protein [Paenibacillus alvei]|uniref:DUF1885 family protein n=1 Tax=Paenibacillus alvei TaxID=44250 RepID=UPI0002883244|nr:DUF1885 family protein [Paenibacillus alvei]EJW17465.1 hypothetical protein PAV_4c05760 [Paenibacillus alvei DSM 29]MCY9540341.1 DUF1885 family protein [Paenibacillus alvei]MCY9705890.1 DUF1885 family protein [Paenibacillus alvei]MCY9737027.1 DUF1885 family protein [Paenibacillus alvei]MCY9753415.1 DUF1885 family protein [Paenibacillus alvei]